jgi:GntR family transcriptional repressor for pyruvate dehydrogenase complex
MDFKPIQQQKIYEQIIDQIKAMILRGELKPGDRLPAERALAERLNVSRASVREALRALHLLGLVEIKSGEGTFIKEGDINSAIHILTLLLPIGPDIVTEIAQVRKGIEVEAAGLAAVHAGAGHIETLESIISKMESELATDTLGETTDWNFHFAISQATGNSLYIKLMNTISNTMQKAIHINRERLFIKKEHRGILYQQHLDVFKAVKESNPESARKKMYEHLKYAEDFIIKMMPSEAVYQI